MNQKVNVPHKIICRYCKKEVYVKKYNAKYCSDECRHKAKTMRQREWDKLHREVKTQRKNKPKSKTQLAAIAQEAREHGMSYGMYVSMMQQKGM